MHDVLANVDMVDLSPGSGHSFGRAMPVELSGMALHGDYSGRLQAGNGPLRACLCEASLVMDRTAPSAGESGYLDGGADGPKMNRMLVRLKGADRSTSRDLVRSGKTST